MKDKKQIIAYTDGSAVVNGKYKGAGGFGTYFPDLLGKKKAFSKGFKNTKTGRMEITALLYAIKAIPIEGYELMKLTVYSDSEYVVKCFSEKRLIKWIANDWVNSTGEVKNRDLWELVIDELDKRKFLELELIHIKSHQVEREKDKIKKEQLLKNPHIIGNMMADKLADYKRHKILI